MRRGFRRQELVGRYDVVAFREDDWHTYAGAKTASLVRKYFRRNAVSGVLLNAGSGVYGLSLSGWTEISLDLFSTPLSGRAHSVCGSIEFLPFQTAVFDAVICVGEVLAYCDPAVAIKEFARVIRAKGRLLVDFGTSTGIRHWRRPVYGRAADIVTVEYNGSPERTWVYSPSYVASLLADAGFAVLDRDSTHGWSSAWRRLGGSISSALWLDRHLQGVKFPPAWADVITILAERAETSRK